MSARHPHGSARAEARAKTLRITGLSILGFLLMLTYSVARPATESLFLEQHGSNALPTVWLMVALAAAGAVAVYNRFLPGRDLVGLYAGVCAVSAGLLALLLVARRAQVPGADYALYVWKDVYMVVLVEIFYSFSNAVFPLRTARWAYGWFGVVGSAGGLVGNLAVGAMSKQLGTVGALWTVVPLLLLAAGGAVVLARLAGHRGATLEVEGRPSLRTGFALVRRSQYLLLMLGLIATVQVAVTLVDLQFNTVVEAAYPDRDVRTAEIGFVYAAISAGTLCLHGLTGPVLRLAGVPLTLLTLPLVLAGAVGAFAAAPSVMAAAVAKIASKTFDYTLFRNGKEMLYIPLSYAEKTQGKAIVDMLTYRVAKGGASLLLLGLIATSALRLVDALTLVLIATWLLLTWAIVRRFRQRVSRADELAATSDPA